MERRTGEVVEIALEEIGSSADWTRFNIEIARQMLRQAGTLGVDGAGGYTDPELIDLIPVSGPNAAEALVTTPTAQAIKRPKTLFITFLLRGLLQLSIGGRRLSPAPASAARAAARTKARAPTAAR